MALLSHIPRQQEFTRAWRAGDCGPRVYSYEEFLRAVAHEAGLRSLAPGDTVLVTRIDRLARSTFDLFAIIQRIVDAGAHFRSIAEPFLQG